MRETQRIRMGFDDYGSLSNREKKDAAGRLLELSHDDLLGIVMEKRRERRGGLI